MTDSVFSIKDAWDLQPPCFIRKVERPGHWVGSENSPSDRVTKIREDVFPQGSDKSLSVYMVEDDRDLRRVAVALNANRASLTQVIVVLAIAQSEIDGFSLHSSRGRTKCTRANKLHRDLSGYDVNRLNNLIKTMLKAGRKPKRFTKPKMHTAVKESGQEGCHAIELQSAVCECESQVEGRGRVLDWLTSILHGVLAQLRRLMARVRQSGSD